MGGEGSNLGLQSKHCFRMASRLAEAGKPIQVPRTGEEVVKKPSHVPTPCDDHLLIFSNPSR